MRITTAILLTVACFLGAVEHLEGYRILAAIPTPSYSHQIPYRALWLELAKRGHELVLLTANPFPTNFTNFRQIDVGSTYKDLRQMDFIQLRFEGKTWLHFLENSMLPLGLAIGEAVLNSTELKEMYAPESNEKFDLIIMEMLMVPSTYILAHRFNAPMIGACSLGLMSLTEHALGGVVLPSHDYTWEMEANTGSNLPFWQRLRNFWLMAHMLYYSYTELYPAHQALAEKYFGTDIPSVLDIQKNTSLIFVNQADAVTPARPKLANMISFTSFHVKETLDALKPDLQQFVDSASEGFIYFSLGTNAMSSDLPKNVLQIFLDVFSKLPYKVVWKFEKELPGKPKNVYISKWLPQASLLAHPNVKLFIYQGGLQSSEEAIHFEVPLIGFPVLADQDYQVGRMEALGVGKRLELLTVTRDELESAIREIITDKGYKRRIAELKVLVNDNPHDSVKYLAWWVEFVIRHKGAPHLRSNLALQPWYQRCDIDIVVFSTIIVFVLLSSIISIMAKVAVPIYKQTMSNSRKQKSS